MLRERHEQELAKQLAEEKETQSLLLGLEEDRKRDRRLEMDLLLQEQQTKERLAFQRVLKEAETRIIEEEHAKVRVRRRARGRVKWGVGGQTWRYLFLYFSLSIGLLVYIPLHYLSVSAYFTL